MSFYQYLNVLGVISLSVCFIDGETPIHIGEISEALCMSKELFISKLSTNPNFLKMNNKLKIIKKSNKHYTMKNLVRIVCYEKLKLLY